MSVQACADLVARGDPDRFRAAMAAPVAARAVLFPLYAFNLEVARAPWVASEPMIAEMRLQWWRDALEEIAQGGPVRRHEVTTPLAGVLAPRDAQMLDALVTARRWDVYRDPFDDHAAFGHYLDATAGHLSVAAARAMGVTEGEKALRDIAFAGGLANWLIAIPGLEARGRRPLVDGRPQAVADLAADALDRLARGQRALPGAARPAVFWAAHAGTVLRAARAAPGRVAAGAVAPSEVARRWHLIRVRMGGRL